MDETRMAERRKRAFEGLPPGPARTRNSLLWAALIPVTATFGGFLAQYPYGLLWLGVLLVLAAAGTGAAVAGTGWNRAGVATVVGFGTMALGVFAGPSLYEAYAMRLGERVDAVVIETGERTNFKGDARSFCRVADPSGTVRELGQQQNCYGEFTRGQHVVLFEDPLGLLDPRVEATGDRTLDPLGPGISGGLFLLVGASMFSGGMRRRSDRDILERQRRGRGLPRPSAPPSQRTT
ncbi:hypothetical protein OG429_17220 [Streptomyces sp. NBC_00190]|uniref:hypothetical protein n=1 Tax=unclassified Streptomyces TaxID=2593676 RepID=UPI002E2BA4DA|nr:hypothetical protein [Streptomyces sp. NBC_00190]WSZ40855.1 hypothetical protein OG239_19920 [Streptomyces sp. NBC_00868]